MMTVEAQRRQREPLLSGLSEVELATLAAAGQLKHFEDGAILMLRDDGNLLVVDQNGGQLWATGTRVN